MLGSPTTKDMYEWCVTHDQISLEIFHYAAMAFCNEITKYIRPILGEHMAEAEQEFSQMSHALRRNLLLLRAFLQVAYNDNEHILHDILKSSHYRRETKRKKLDVQTIEA